MNEIGPNTKLWLDENGLVAHKWDNVNEFFSFFCKGTNNISLYKAIYGKRSRFLIINQENRKFKLLFQTLGKNWCLDDGENKKTGDNNFLYEELHELGFQSEDSARVLIDNSKGVLHNNREANFIKKTFHKGILIPYNSVLPIAHGYNRIYRTRWHGGRLALASNLLIISDVLYLMQNNNGHWQQIGYLKEARITEGLCRDYIGSMDGAGVKKVGTLYQVMSWCLKNNHNLSAHDLMTIFKSMENIKENEEGALAPMDIPAKTRDLVDL